MSYPAIFRNSGYRNFWLGSTFSYMGDAMTNVALVWLTYALTGSPAYIAALLVCYTAPVIVGGLVAGSLLDRFDRRRLMIADNCIRGVAVASIPVLNAVGLFSIWDVYVVALVYGFFYMITLAGAPSIIPDLVEEKELNAANSLETITFTISGVLGPPIAGIIIVVSSAQNVMLVDAISYLALVLALSSFRIHHEIKPQERRNQTNGIREAFRLLVSNKVLLSTTLMFASFNFGEGLLSLWLPVLSKTVFLGGPQLYGLLLSAIALGQVAGASVAGLASTRWPLGKLIIASQSASGISVALFFFGQSPWLAGIALALLGFFSAPLTAWAQTLRMKIIPTSLRGRTFALLRTLMQGASPAGSGVGGLLFPFVGLYGLIALSTLLIGGGGVAGSGIADLRRANEHGS